MDATQAIQLARDWTAAHGHALPERCDARLITADCPGVSFDPPELATAHEGWWVLVFYAGTALDGERILRVHDASGAVEWLSRPPRRGWLSRLRRLLNRNNR